LQSGGAYQPIAEEHRRDYAEARRRHQAHGIARRSVLKIYFFRRGLGYKPVVSAAYGLQ